MIDDVIATKELSQHCLILICTLTILVEWRYGYCWVAHSHAPWNVSQQEWQKHVFFPVENKTKGDVLASFCISNVFKRFFTRDARCFCELDHRQARALTSSKGTKPKWGPFQITSLHGNACALDLCLISHMSQFFSVHYTLKGLHNNDTAIEYLLNGKFITQFVS